MICLELTGIETIAVTLFIFATIWLFAWLVFSPITFELGKISRAIKSLEQTIKNMKGDKQ